MNRSDTSFNKKKDLWDRQYAAGQWEVLRSPLEEPRLNTLAALTSQYCQGGNVLEIGCGEGLLLPRLKSTYQYFLGLDISEVAIRKTQHLQNANTVFKCADMEDFVPGSKFDIIIFNESLYYSDTPLELLHRYTDYLEKDGLFATSIYHDEWNISLVDLIRKKFEGVKRQETSNERGTWYCDVFKPSRTKA
ncbi:class I SAM-dependent methyltransferase [Chitinophaga pendula]|uniref:class I SAM-dependent methyltransferase n=1 Tax=Chitinophaga TaxID=79328 RepID=UPI000BAEA8C1|nr:MULTISPECIES: class I SAM-dependent methyltransferase [Chitinophaga]ASZ11875.1 hypothetical protein CK934_13355 [Chitinophaga sp. MD30]UCJ05100.1 class I SAM-dependent methyltransferase [Chitinophaga pendula]